MSSASRLGDHASGHDCHFPPTPAIEASSDVIIERLPAVREGDAFGPHACSSCNEPEHPRHLASGSTTVFINGKPAGRAGDPISCGGTITEGSATVFIGD